jgi:hypothetical protein
MSGDQLSLLNYKPPKQGQLFDHRNHPTEVSTKPPWKLGSFEGRIEVYAVEDYYTLLCKPEGDIEKQFIIGENVNEINPPLTHQPLCLTQRVYGLRFIDSNEPRNYKTTRSLAQALKKVNFLKEGIRWRHPYGQDELLERSRGQIVAKWNDRRDRVRVKCYLTIDEILEIESYLI